ncbi:MAG: cytochrome c [Candidatus Rokubacteria bacterium]|nr:cytochrome c [Candidatus Rokubacteria bacterium]
MRLFATGVAWLGALVLATTAMAADADLGKKLWAQKCAMCHGADGKGDAKMAERLKAKIPGLGTSAGKTDSELLKAIADGKRPMPAFGKSLKSEELEAVLQHAKGLAKRLAAGK